MLDTPIIDTKNKIKKIRQEIWEMSVRLDELSMGLKAIEDDLK